MEFASLSSTETQITSVRPSFPPFSSPPISTHKSTPSPPTKQTSKLTHLLGNWFGGQAVSLALNYTHATEFRASGYTPFTAGNGTEYGEGRQYGNFSFLRVYEAGHEIPYYQPEASLAFFERVLSGKVLSDGKEVLTGGYSSKGNATATHTEGFVALPLETKGH